MDAESVRTDLFVASVAAGATVALAVIFRFIVTGASDLYLEAAPLVVYFVYLFTHTQLPDSVDQRRIWAGVTIAVAVGSLTVALL